MLTSRREIRSAKGPNCPKRPKWEIPSHWRRWEVPFQWDFQFQHRTIRFAIRPWVARLQDGCRLIDGVARTSQLMNRELCSPDSWKSIKGLERSNVSALLLPVPASHVTNKGLFSARYSQRNLQVNKFHPILTQHLHLEPNANNSGPYGVLQYIPTCRLDLLDGVTPSVKFNSSTWTVEDKCGLRGYGQRPKKKGKAKLQQHTSAEPSLVGSCRKSARHPVIAQNAIALLQKSYVCLRGVCWCQAFAVSNRAHRQHRLRNRCSSCCAIERWTITNLTAIFRWISRHRPLFLFYQNSLTLQFPDINTEHGVAELPTRERCLRDGAASE